jgi:tetratricopeptide (TPR) repeat protein
LAALCAVPLIALLGLEGILRLAGYGYDPRLFSTVGFGGKECLVNNEDFSRRFFPEELARWPSPILMPARKPPGAWRVFILGESAAQGDPQPAFGPARYLEVLLRERYPGVDFEVVNVAITAINSHVILPIARECARRQGDLWIVYMGNNEMVGPFGAATVFGLQAPPLPLARASIALQATRVGQAVADFGRWLRKSDSGANAWGGMQMFLGNEVSPGDPRRQRAYRNFQGNLRDILRAGLDSGAKVVLNTVAVNLRDCPPFASVPASQSGDLLNLGRAAQERGDAPRAAQFFAQAAALDPQIAEVQFRWGQCLLAMTNLAAAHTHLQSACDDDALPFRADSPINASIRRAAQEMAGPNLALCDAAQALEAQNPDGVCGQETFYEHVHFNFGGSYRLGLLWAAQAERFLPGEIKSRARGGWPSREICDRRLGLTDWNRRDVWHALIGRLSAPPLSSQSNNSWRLNRLQSELARVEQGLTAERATEAGKTYEEAIRHTPQDFYLHENYAECLQLLGRIAQAADEWRQAYQLMPRNPFAWLTEGQLLERLGQAGAARAAFQQAIAIHPRYAEAWLELGKLDADEGLLQAAIDKYRHCAQLQPFDPEPYLCLGKAFSLLKMSSQSMDSFRRALRLKPDYWEAHYALGGELGTHGQISQAKTEFQEAIRLQPAYAMAHLNLGVALMKLGQLEDARQQFIETLRLEPHNKFAPAALAQVKSLEADKH